MCRSKAPLVLTLFVEWYPVRPNRVPFNRAFRLIGLWTLRVGNGTQAVPYGFAQHPIHRQITSCLTAA